jgi:GAF domain-containing protein
MKAICELSGVLTAGLDALTGDVELSDALTRLCRGLCSVLPADGAAVCLLDEGGRVRTVAASDEAIHRIESLQQTLGEGPCVQVAENDVAVLVEDLGDEGGRWPGFESAAGLAGMASTACLPVRGGGALVGVLCLFRRRPDGFAVEELTVAELFTHLAAALVVADRRCARSQEVIEQLEYALTNRVIIEQAKGMLAVRFATSVDDAFELMRRHARSTNQRVEAVARQVLAGHITEGRPTEAERSAV